MVDRGKTGDETGGEREESLSAREKTPWLNVHALSEFIFCPRAGLIAYELGGEDPGEEVPLAPRLDYLSLWTVRMIEEELQSLLCEVWEFLRWAAGAAFCIFIIWLFVDWRLAAILLVASVFPSWWVLERLVFIGDLVGRRKAARDARQWEPDFTTGRVQPVNWWGLQNAGYGFVPFREPLPDAGYRLSGRPWKGLEKGPTKIPVMRTWGKDAELYPKHYARVAAYCHLIEACEGAQSPFGVILFRNTYNGVAVLNNWETRRTFHEGLREARRIIEQVESGGREPRAPGASRCKYCPIGERKAFEPGKTETVIRGVALPVFTPGESVGVLYHSPCGDRYRWVPPHWTTGEWGYGSDDDWDD